MNFQRLIKKFNYKLVEYQKRKRSTFVFGYPYWLTIDPSSVCGLECVFCPTGQKRGTRSAALMSFEKFKKIIDKLGPFLYHIDFCNWGEPFMNRELTAMVRYAAKYGPAMKVDTNLNYEMSEKEASAILTSGLNSINMSVDGASQETYGIYRRNGDFSKALRNMRLLVRKKRELGLTAPRLHWQFLVFRHNEHEIEKARSMASEIGVDSIGFTGPFCSPEWVPTIEAYNNYIKREEKVAFKAETVYCDWPWDGITINADGSVSPCCSVEDQKDDFDNIFAKPFWMIWNGGEYRAARKFIRGRGVSGRQNVCTRCDHIGASNHAGVEFNEGSGR